MTSTTSADERHAQPSLVYPFYLDADMSMAFAAAISGGVALSEEVFDRSEEVSESVKKLRGSLRFLGGFDLGGDRGRTDQDGVVAESRLTRHHTAASIFINLHDELTRSGELSVEPSFEDVQSGDIVSMRVGPAVAPLRRVVDQVIRLLSVMVPMLGSERDLEQLDQQSRSKQSKPKRPTELPGGMKELDQLRRLFIALRDDLDESGMIDMVLRHDEDESGETNLLLTLDKRFVSPPALELLHT